MTSIALINFLISLSGGAGLNHHGQPVDLIIYLLSATGHYTAIITLVFIAEVSSRRLYMTDYIFIILFKLISDIPKHITRFVTFGTHLPIINFDIDPSRIGINGIWEFVFLIEILLAGFFLRLIRLK